MWWLRDERTRFLLFFGIGALADFLAAFVLARVIPLGFGTAFRLLLFMTGVLLFLTGLPSGTAMPETAVYRNPYYYVPSRYARPTSREEARDRSLARARKPLAIESLAGLALLALALVLSVLPPF
ncbi:MAG TPA: hypothetical protein VIL45_05190 [Thermoplasmata archaeon]